MVQSSRCKLGIILGWAMAIQLLAAFTTSAQDVATHSSSYPPPRWAFPSLYPDTSAAAGSERIGRGSSDQSTALRVPGSSLVVSQLDSFNVPDWHPEDHPPMPEIVRVGRRPAIQACAYCHLPNGHGGPSNGSLAELPESYIIRQIADFRTGLRREISGTSVMEEISKSLTDEEIQQAARYYSKLKRRRWIRVVEAETVPKTYVRSGQLIPAKGNESEALGTRIVEIPENPERTELHDDRSG